MYFTHGGTGTYFYTWREDKPCFELGGRGFFFWMMLINRKKNICLSVVRKPPAGDGISCPVEA